MASPIRLTEPQLLAVKGFVQLPLESLNELTTATSSANWIEVEEFEAKCKEIVGNDELAVATVRTALLARSISQRIGTDLSSAIESIRLAVSEADIFDEKALLEFDKRVILLSQLASSESSRIVSKALELSYEYENLFQTGLIVTDIRPIFSKDENVSKIVGSIISYTLRLRYSTSRGDREIEVAMDTSDVKKLFDQCERSLKKAAIAKSHMASGGSPISTMIAGGNP